MSFSFSFTAPDKASAKTELAERNEQSGGHMPDAMEDAVSAMIDAMPDAPEGNVFNVSTYGHAASDDNPGQSNITLSVSHVIA